MNNVKICSRIVLFLLIFVVTREVEIVGFVFEYLIFVKISGEKM